MTETKVQSLERGINSKLNIPLNAKICLKVEELLRNTEPDNKPGIKCAFPHRGDLDCRLVYSVNQAIFRLDIPEPEQDQMFCHCELYKLTSQTLTDSEFDIMFPLSGIDGCFEKSLRDHNRRCLVFFLNGYRELVYPILAVKEQGFHPVITESLTWLGKMIERHHELRTYFPYCNTCPFNGGERCQFWDGVFLKLRTICADSDEACIAKELTQYCTQLTIECKIPIYYNELTKGEKE